MVKNKLLIVGLGKMGSALAEGLITKKVFTYEQLSALEPNLQLSERNNLNYQIYNDINQIKLSDYQIILFAVKPQILPSIIDQYKNLDCLFISIAAGITTNFFSQNLSDNCKIVRVMPNFPASIGKGVTAGFENSNVSNEERDIVNKIFSSIGVFAWVDNESDIDAVTAISGSGPAYVYYFMECLAEAGIELGLNKELSNILAFNTVYGSSFLANKTGYNVKELKTQIISPNGTTYAALEKLTDGKFKKAILNATKAAKKRSEELSKI